MLKKDYFFLPWMLRQCKSLKLSNAIKQVIKQEIHFTEQPGKPVNWIWPIYDILQKKNYKTILQKLWPKN